MTESTLIDDETTFNGSTSADFGTAQTTQSVFASAEDEAAAKARKHAIKSDVVSAVASIAINSIPLIADVIKHRKDPTPYKVNGGDVARIVATSIVPVVKVVDTVALNGKLQNVIAEKTPFTLNDVRNVVNVVALYPAAKVATQTFIENTANASSGNPKIESPEGTSTSLWTGVAALAAPFVADKLTNDDLSFKEKVTSVLPVGMIGPWVKRFASMNPKTRQIYDATQAVVGVAQYGSKALSGATRSSPNSTVNKASNQAGEVLGFIQDITGMNRGGYNGYNNNGYYGNNSWGGNSRSWNGGF